MVSKAQRAKKKRVDIEQSNEEPQQPHVSNKEIRLSNWAFLHLLFYNHNNWPIKISSDNKSTFRSCFNVCKQRLDKAEVSNVSSSNQTRKKG